MNYIFITLVFSIIATAETKWTDWDGNYEKAQCNSSEECTQIAASKNMKNQRKEAMPYMAKACMLGNSNFCWLVGYSSKFPKFLDNGYKFYKQGCAIENKIGNNCRAMIDGLLMNGNLEEAKETYKSLCYDASEINCSYGNGRVSPKAKEYVKNLQKEQARMLEELCKEGHAVSCKFKNR